MKDMSEYEANARLMRWAVGRGFTFDIIRQCIDGVEELEDDAEEN